MCMLKISGRGNPCTGHSLIIKSMLAGGRYNAPTCTCTCMPFSSSLVMSVRCGGFVEQEQLPQVVAGEVSLHVLLLVHHTAAQGLLVSLALEYLLLNGASLWVCLCVCVCVCVCVYVCLFVYHWQATEVFIGKLMAMG